MSGDDCEVFSSFTMNILLVISFVIGFFFFKKNKVQRVGCVQFKEGFEDGIYNIGDPNLEKLDGILDSVNKRDELK